MRVFVQYEGSKGRHRIKQYNLECNNKSCAAINLAIANHKLAKIITTTHQDHALISVSSHQTSHYYRSVRSVVFVSLFRVLLRTASFHLFLHLPESFLITIYPPLIRIYTYTYKSCTNQINPLAPGVSQKISENS